MKREAKPPEAVFRICDTIHPLLHENGVLYLDERTGAFHNLNKLGKSVLEVINQTGREADITTFMEAHVNDAPKTATSEWMQSLLENGIIQQAITTTPSPRQLAKAQKFDESELLATGDTPLAWDTVDSIQLNETEHTLASAALERSLALGNKLNEDQRFFQKFVAYLKNIQLPTYQPASEAELLHTLAAIHYVGRDYMGRLNCLETAVATYIATTLQKRRSKLVFGARLDPNGFHSWITTTNDTPIRLATDPPIAGVFHPFFSVE